MDFASLVPLWFYSYNGISFYQHVCKMIALLAIFFVLKLNLICFALNILIEVRNTDA